MSVEVLKYMAMGAYIAAAVLFVLAIVLFFVLKIPAVIGDLTGATARKAIENIRQQNEETGEKKHSPSAVNKERGRVTDRISPSGNLQHVTGVIAGAGETEKISTGEMMSNYTVGDSGATTVLTESANETTILNQGYGETEVLTQPVSFGETEVLSPATEFGTTGELIQPAPMPTSQPGVPVTVTIDVEMGFSESTETID